MGHITDEPFNRLPEEVTVSFAEARAVIVELERVLGQLRRVPSLGSAADQVDGVIGRITRWIWPLLGELDDDHDQ